MQVSTRRSVASVGGWRCPVSGSRRTRSATSTAAGTSAAHSPIAANDLAPASTAHTATATTAVRPCRRPRRLRGSGNRSRCSHRSAHRGGSNSTGTSSCEDRAAISDDVRAGTAFPREHGSRQPHDHRRPCPPYLHSGHTTPTSPATQPTDKSALCKGPGSGGEQHAFAEQVEFGPAVHLSFDRLDAVDVSFYRAG